MRRCPQALGPERWEEASRSPPKVKLDGRIQDLETGSIWNLAGRAVEGELAGTQLEHLPARTTFWFLMAANFPEIEEFEINHNNEKSN